MFRKLIGDVKHGYVESAHGNFVVYGDREKTLAAIKSSGRRNSEPEMTTRQFDSLPKRIGDYIPINTLHGIGYIAADLLSSNTV